MGPQLCYAGFGCLGCSFCDGGRPALPKEEKKPLTVKLGDILRLKLQQEKGK